MADRRIKTTNYFPHDSNARNDEKLVRLRMKQGAAGYGVYFMILERLRDDTGYKSAKDYNMIAFDLRVDAALVKSVVEDFGLFVFTDDGKYFYSESFSHRMGIKDNLSHRRSEAGKKGNEIRWGKTSQQPAKQATDDKYIERFFGEANKANLEVLLMNFGMSNNDMPRLRKLANVVVAEWKASAKGHNDYTDWSQHLIATMRIKLNQPNKNSTVKTNEPPQAKDYSFGGGFGGQDV
jgi:hypothetical protein